MFYLTVPASLDKKLLVYLEFSIRPEDIGCVVKSALCDQRWENKATNPDFDDNTNKFVHFRRTAHNIQQPGLNTCFITPRQRYHVEDQNTKRKYED